MQLSNNNDAKGGGPTHLVWDIGLAGGGNNPGNIEIPVQDWTRCRRGHPPLGVISV